MANWYLRREYHSGKALTRFAFVVQHSMCQVPLSLLLAVVFQTSFKSCSRERMRQCLPLIVAPVTLLVEVGGLI